MTTRLPLLLFAGIVGLAANAASQTTTPTTPLTTVVAPCVPTSVAEGQPGGRVSLLTPQLRPDPVDVGALQPRLLDPAFVSPSRDVPEISRFCACTLREPTAGEIADRKPDPSGNDVVTVRIDPALCVTPVQVLEWKETHQGTADVESYVSTLVRALAADPGAAVAMGNPSRDYYRLVWTPADDDGDLTVRSLVLNLRSGLTTVLPGIAQGSTRELRDVLITASRDAILVSLYQATPQADPVAAQLAAVVEKMAGAALTFAAGAAGVSPFAFVAPPPEEPAAPPPVAPMAVRPRKLLYELPSIRYVINEAVPADARASLAVGDVVVSPSSIRRLMQAAGDAALDLSLKESRRSPCGLDLAKRQAAAIGLVAASAACQAGQSGTEQQRRAVCSNALNGALDEELAASPACQDPPGAPDGVTLADARFRSIVNGFGEQRVIGATTLTNRPASYFGFGLLTATRLGNPSFDQPRVKVGDDRKIVEDPLPSLLTAAIVNWHPWGFDAESTDVLKPAWGERARFFGGTTLTPDFGLTAGFGVGIIRSVSLNVGWAWLFAQTPKPGETLGNVVTDANKGDPLKTATIGTAYVGLSFAFQ